MMKKTIASLTITTSFIFSCAFAAESCYPVSFGQDSTVCECTLQHCDSVEPVGSLSEQDAAVYTSTPDGKRLQRDTIHFSPNASLDTAHIELNAQQHYQTILGFGGAFTDSAGRVITSLDPALQHTLLAAYFSPDGIEYTLGRVPMASTDFSDRIYSYDDTPNDFDLNQFALADEDTQYKIPLIKAAARMAHRPLTLFASPWSAPAWLKENNSLINGKLRGIAGDHYHKTYAHYFSRFFDAYAQKGIHFWGVTLENEPTDNLGWFQSMLFSPEEERDFIKYDLGAELHATHPEVHLMILDDNVGFLPTWTNTILGDPDALKYVSGTGIHWYFAPENKTSLLDQTHAQFPNQFILSTEASNGMLTGPKLGNWTNGILYAKDIIEDMQHWVIGWTDWNLALTPQGGSTWAKNYVDAPIIVDAPHHVFYKQPMYYFLGHFSKFIPQGSVRIDATCNAPSLKTIAVTTPHHTTVIVVLNLSGAFTQFNIHDPHKGYLHAAIPAWSIQTYLYKANL